MDIDTLLSKELLINVALAAAAILFLAILIFAINRGFRFIYTQVNKHTGGKIKGISVKNYDILTPNYTARLIIGGLKIIRALVLLIVFYFWLPLLFSIFPWTEDLADTLIDYTLAPLASLGKSFIDYLPSLFFIIIILVLVRYLGRVLKFFSNEIKSERLKIDGFYKDWARPTYVLLKIGLYIFAIVLIFPYLPGSDSPAFQGVSIFMGVLLSLGSTGLVANAVGGLMIIYMRPFVIGDVVKIGDNIGTVVAKGMLVTRLNTTKNEEISVPNKMIVEHQIVNYSSEAKGKGVFIHSSITIGYDVPWKIVHEILLEAANRTKDILDEPASFVLQKALNDFSVEYELNGYSDAPKKMAHTYSELHQHIQDGFRENNIEILSPIYNVERRSNELTIPKE